MRASVIAGEYACLIEEIRSFEHGKGMKLNRRILTWGLAVIAWAILPGTLLAQNSDKAAGSTAASPKPVPLPIGQDNISFRNEIQLSIDRGLQWLTQNQNSNGWWSTPTHPAITALALTAFNGDPQNRFRGKEPEHLKRAYQFILSCAKEDGSIRTTNLYTYNTAISMMALITSNNSEYDPIVRRARQFLIGVQNDFGKPGQVDTPHDGGFGYGTPETTRSDMINTVTALEALYYSKRLAADQPQSGANDLNWQAAIQFIQTCQNLPGSNKEPWVSSNPDDLGGFVYNPGRSDAGGETNEVTGKVSLRSYGSVSYAGLLSFIYADVKKDDPHVKAVFDWLSRHYTLDQNPGLGKQGLFYYYHTMAKALTAAGISEVQLANGKTVNWRFDLDMKLMQLQQRDGSWANDNPRWMEKDPELVTSYVLLALEFLSRSLEG